MTRDCMKTSKTLQHTHLEGDCLEIAGVPTLALGKRRRLELVAKQKVDVRHLVHQRLFKRRHLADEWCRQVGGVDAVVLRAVLGQEHARLGGHGDEEAGAVDDGGLGCQRPHLGFFQVLRLVVWCGLLHCV